MGADGRSGPILSGRGSAAGKWMCAVASGTGGCRPDGSTWVNRPDDARYPPLDDLWASVKGRSERGRARKSLGFWMLFLTKVSRISHYFHFRRAKIARETVQNRPGDSA